MRGLGCRPKVDRSIDLFWGGGEGLRRGGGGGGGGGRARLGALFCMRARVARLLRFDSTSGHGREHHLDVPVPISLCPSARAVRRIEIFLRT